MLLSFLRYKNLFPKKNIKLVTKSSKHFIITNKLFNKVSNLNILVSSTPFNKSFLKVFYFFKLPFYTLYTYHWFINFTLKYFYYQIFLVLDTCLSKKNTLKYLKLNYFKYLN